MDIGKENETEEAKKFKKTKLTWDDYMDYLIEAINESNFMKRSETRRFGVTFNIKSNT